MENEVSGIAKLGIVLIALAVLIGLGFGIFQISKSVANDGVGDVQAELDSVATSAFTTYDQKTITGTMASSSISDFEGESVAVLIATQAWINAIADNGITEAGDMTPGEYANFAGLDQSYEDGVTELPVVWAYKDQAFGGAYTMSTSKGVATPGSFINYNAILGNPMGVGGGNTAPEGCTDQMCDIGGTSGIFMAGIYFDTNCFRVTSGFATDASGRVLYNNVTGNLSKSGRVEYIPSGAKFDSFLVKDASGTYMGIALTQLNG